MTAALINLIDFQSFYHPQQASVDHNFAVKMNILLFVQMVITGIRQNMRLTLHMQSDVWRA